MKPTLLLLVLAALGFAQAGSIAGMPGARPGPRWNAATTSRAAHPRHNTSEYRVHPPGSGFNRPQNGPNPNQDQLNGPNSPDPFMPPHGGAGR
jgi:hypothetical protein